MQSNLTVFANFFIDNEERFLRMKDSFESMRGIEVDRYVVNVRGRFSTQALEYLNANIKSLCGFSIESSAGWFYDTSKLLNQIKTSYVLLWVEDHICMNPYAVNSVVNDMAMVGADLLTYTFWQNGNFLRRYSAITQKDAGSITWFDHSIEENYLINNSSYGPSYLIPYVSIIKFELFGKIIGCGGDENRWSNLTPFNFEKPPEATHWLPLRRANPKSELFASIDDDHGEIGSCLQSRGLYPKRVDRQTYTVSRDVEGFLVRASKRIRGRLGWYKGFLLNLVQTPSEYRFDYLLSHFLPHRLVGRPLPWMNYAVIQYLLSRMTNIYTLFEYGSGQSTLFWASRGKNVFSIEHDPDFYVSMAPKVASIPRVSYRLIEPEIDESRCVTNPSSPGLCHSAEFRGYKFKKYVESIGEYEDNHFDVVVVDGRARPSCVARSISKVKPGGILILDNSNREYYLQEAGQLLCGWHREVFYSTVRGLIHKEQTTVFVKPLA